MHSQKFPINLDTPLKSPFIPLFQRGSFKDTTLGVVQVAGVVDVGQIDLAVDDFSDRETGVLEEDI